MIIGLSLFVAIVSLVIYLVSDPERYPKVQELARISYFAGLLVFLFQAREVVSLLLG